MIKTFSFMSCKCCLDFRTNIFLCIKNTKKKKETKRKEKKRTTDTNIAQTLFTIHELHSYLHNNLINSHSSLQFIIQDSAWSGNSMSRFIWWTNSSVAMLLSSSLRLACKIQSNWNNCCSLHPHSVKFYFDRVGPTIRLITHKTWLK